MPEHIRALIVVLALLTASMVCMRGATHSFGMDPKDYTRRCLTWIGLTVIAYLSHNFWLFCVSAAILISITARRDSNPPALYLSLLFAVPPLSAAISGFGVLQQLFELSYYRLLSLTILLPIYISLLGAVHKRRRQAAVIDILILSYIALGLILQLSVDTATNTLRSAFYAFIDVYLPYYVVSRYVVTLEARRQAILAIVMAMLLLAPIAMFEFAKRWLLYNNVQTAMGLPLPEIPAYIYRGNFLRATATLGQPIVLGYVMAIAVIFYTALQRNGERVKYWTVGLLVLLVGVVMPLSRGPWVGLGVGVLILFLTSPNRLGWLFRLLLASLLAVPILALSGFADRIIEFLPFIGSVDRENVLYRSTLIDVTMHVIWLSPWFGSFDFLSHPAFAVLDQGGGVVDFTNTYIVVALTSGLVGLGLFSGAFLFSGMLLWRSLIGLHQRETELFTQGRVILAALGATVVTIATVSSIFLVPTVYWIICGLAVGYINQMKDISVSGASK